MTREPEIQCFVVGLLEGNCYLVRSAAGRTAVVIDPGDEAERLGDAVEADGLDPKVILLTHGHIDHTNAAAALRARFKSRVICHQLDAPMVRGEEGGSLFGFVRNRCDVDQEVSDGEVVEAGGVRFTVLHTPGHTCGSVCYVLDGVLFSGDTIFQGSIGRTDLPGGSDHEMYRSLHERIAKLEEATVVYPGHGPSTTIGDEKRSNPFLQPEW
jgi:hydroxyacylglutathione hydrolase